MSHVNLLFRLRHTVDNRYTIEIQRQDGAHATPVEPLANIRPRPVFEMDWVAARERSGSALGQWLGERLLAHKACASAWEAALAVAGPHGVVRLRLDLDDALHALPWEAMQLPPLGSVASSQRVLFSRYLESNRGHSIAPLSDAARAVVAVADPENIAQYGLSRPNATQFEQAALTNLDGFDVELVEATLVDIQAALTVPTDVLYIVAHGLLSQGEPYLLLEDDASQSARVSGTDLAQDLLNLSHIPKLVVLVSCHSAGTGHLTAETDVMNALGPRLVRAGVAAVVAMRAEVSMATAAAMLPRFFAELARDGTVDRALAAARRSVAARLDAAAAVCYLRLTDERIWHRTEPAAKTVPFMAEPLPEHYVERSDILAQARTQLIATTTKPTASVFGLDGAGGYGKTMLAQALCHDADVRRAFPDGVLWVSLGEQPTEAALLAHLNALGRRLGNARNQLDLIAAKEVLAHALANKQLLLVVDDVWRSQDLAPFLAGGERVTRLVTTRLPQKLPPNSTLLTVEQMDKSVAIDLLTAGLAPEQVLRVATPAWQALADNLGEWPLLLGMVRGVLQERVAYGLAVADAYTEVVAELEVGGLRAFDASSPETRLEAVQATLAVSLNQLNRNRRFRSIVVDEHARYHELAVFPEDVDTPTAALTHLWPELRGKQVLVRKLCEQFERLNLLRRYDRQRQTIRLHDILRQYLIEEMEVDEADYHGKLLAGYAATTPAGWHTLQNDGYVYQHLAYHLSHAGRSDELRTLLLSFNWLESRLRHTDIIDLLADFTLVSEPDRYDAINLLGGALRLSARALATDKRQLAGQLIGRLAGWPDDTLTQLLANAKQQLEQTRQPLPARRTLHSPAGPVIHTFAAEQGEISSYSLLANETQILVTGESGPPILWDLHTGRPSQIFAELTGLVTFGAHFKQETRAVAINNIGHVGVWELASGQLVHFIMPGDSTDANWVTANALVADRELLVSGTHQGWLRIYDLSTGRVRHVVTCDADPIEAIYIVPGEQHAVGIHASFALTLLDLNDGIAVYHPGRDQRPAPGRPPVRLLASLSGGQHLLFAAPEQDVWLLDVQTGIRRHLATNHMATVWVFENKRQLLTGNDSGTITLWDLDTLTRRCEFQASAPISCAPQLFADETRLVTGDQQGEIIVWDLQSGAKLQTMRRASDNRQPVLELMLLQKDPYLLVSDANPGFSLWDLTTGTLLDSFTGHEGRTTIVGVSPEEKEVLALDATGRLIHWDIPTRQPRHTVQIAARPRHLLAFSANAVRAHIINELGQLIIYNLETGVVMTHAPTQRSSTSRGNVIWLSDKRRAIAFGSGDGMVLWDLTVDEPEHSALYARHSENSLTLLPNGVEALSTGRFGTIRHSNVETGETLNTLTGHYESVTSLRLLPDGQRAVSADSTGRIIVWNLVTMSQIHTLDSGLFWADHLTLLDETRLLATAFAGSTTVWDMVTGKLIYRMIEHTSSIQSVTLLDNNKQALLVERSEPRMILWDLTTGEARHTMVQTRAAGKPAGYSSADSLQIRLLGLANNERHAVVVDIDSQLFVWDLASGTPLYIWRDRFRVPRRALLLANGTHLLAIARDRTVHLIDLTTGDLRRALVGHESGPVTLFALAKDTRAASVDMEGTLILWDLASGTELQRITGVGADVTPHLLAEHPNFLITTNDVGTIMVWDRDAGELHQTLSGPASSFVDACLLAGETQLLIGYADGRLVLWELASQQQRWAFTLDHAVHDIRRVAADRILVVDEHAQPHWLILPS